MNSVEAGARKDAKIIPEVQDYVLGFKKIEDTKEVHF